MHSLKEIIYHIITNLDSELIIQLPFSFLTGKILKGFDEGLLTVMILIDLNKAFNTIMKFFSKKSKQRASLRDALHGFSHIFLKEYFS